MNHQPATSPRRIAESSGVALCEDETGRLIFAEYGGNWTATTQFVLGLLTLQFGVGGCIATVLALRGRGVPLLLGMSFLGAGALLALLLWTVRRKAKQLRDRPLAEVPVLLVLDLKGGAVLDARGQPLAPLASLRFRRGFQLASSSPALVAEMPGGKRTLVRGNPFAGGIRAITRALESRGFRI